MASTCCSTGSAARIAIAYSSLMAAGSEATGEPEPEHTAQQPRVSFSSGTTEQAVPARQAGDAAAPQQFLDFEIPAGAAPGQTLMLQLPSGKTAGWVMPEGLSAGDMCRLPLPEGEMDGGHPAGGEQPNVVGLAAENHQRREEAYLKIKAEKEASGGHTVGDIVKTWQGEKGTVRYIGELEGQKAGKIWIGVEWASPGRGKNDGSVPSGRRYFECEMGMGSFIDAKKQSKHLDSRYNQYLEAAASAAMTSTTAG